MPKHRDRLSSEPVTTLSDAARRVIEARHHDPFEYLGKHPAGSGKVSVRAFLPQTTAARIVENDAVLERLSGTDLFEWQGEEGQIPDYYRIEWTDSHGNVHIAYDPYCLPPRISDYDIHLFSEGRHHHAAGFLGARPHEMDGIHGILFATWAPNAERVSVVGDFNQWDGRRHPMRVRGSSGLWEIFIPGLQHGCLYKFEVRNARHGSLHLKTDPYGRCFEVRPRTAAIAVDDSQYQWQDQQWLEQRVSANWLNRPMSIYEVHPGSWRRHEDGGFLSYRELAPQLVGHVKALGFTHIELLPITEHPLDASWGYQTTGYFAPTSRYGSPDDFRYFVDYCHQHGLGIILDWVPGHFPRDSHGLAQFDGTPVYEHEDPRRGEHRDWGTLIFNYGRNEVRNFLLSSALFWLEEYHLDGLRVDAVASMIYLDYSRSEGDWIPNIYGGNENLEAIAFLREMNALTHQQCPGTVVIAEESTAWPMVSRPTWLGGLGFSMKWNMGWMHDTLEYMSQDPIYRHYHHDMLTFSQLYAYTENFVLPFSHDEVVHGKRSILYRMPGDEWQQFANLRLLYAYMFTHPGKKLLFMGCEFGQGQEWDHTRALDWYVLDYPHHQGVQALIRDLNHLYHQYPALYQYDFDQQGFGWISCHDSTQSVLAYLRRSDHQTLIIVLNFTPVIRYGYTIGVPHEGEYVEILNTDSEYYHGSNVGNAAPIMTRPGPWMGYPCSIDLTLPPLGAVILRLKTGQDN